jgi:hypothetical protein
VLSMQGCDKCESQERRISHRDWCWRGPRPFRRWASSPSLHRQ